MPAPCRPPSPVCAGSGAGHPLAGLEARAARGGYSLPAAAGAGRGGGCGHGCRRLVHAAQSAVRLPDAAPGAEGGAADGSGLAGMCAGGWCLAGIGSLASVAPACCDLLPGRPIGIAAGGLCLHSRMRAGRHHACASPSLLLRRHARPLHRSAACPPATSARTCAPCSASTNTRWVRARDVFCGQQHVSAACRRGARPLQCDTAKVRHRSCRPAPAAGALVFWNYAAALVAVPGWMVAYLWMLDAFHLYRGS